MPRISFYKQKRDQSYAVQCVIHSIYACPWIWVQLFKTCFAQSLFDDFFQIQSRDNWWPNFIDTGKAKIALLTC